MPGRIYYCMPPFMRLLGAEAFAVAQNGNPGKMRLPGKAVLLPGMAMLALTLISCAGVRSNVIPLNAERPKDAAFRIVLNKEMSTLNIDVEASAGELGDTLSRIMARELYRGSTRTRGLTADILRNGPVAVSAVDNYLYLTIPISMSLSYGGFETPAIATKLKFRLNPRVTPDWKINVDAYYAGLGDLLAEEVGIGPLSIKPRGIVEEITQPLQRTLSDLINRKLNGKFPLESRVAGIWNDVQKPILLDRNYNAWLVVTPREVLLYPLYARNNRVKLSVGLKSFAELVMGPEPPARAPVPLPGLKPANGADRTFRVALNTDLYYRDILNIASPLLLNKELGSNGKSVILKDLDLFGNGDRLIIKVETTGSLNGIFYLTCRPVFDPRTGVFSVEDVDFDMQTRSLLLKSADWFLHGSIRDSIREKLNMNLTQRLAQARELAGKAMARVNLAENVFFTGNIKSLRLNDVIVQKDKLSIQVCAEGESAIFLH